MANSKLTPRQQEKLQKIRAQLYESLDIHHGMVSGALLYMENNDGPKVVRRHYDQEAIMEGLRISSQKLDNRIVKILEFTEKLTG